jgi:hypothetical protein
VPRAAKAAQSLEDKAAAIAAATPRAAIEALLKALLPKVPVSTRPAMRSYDDPEYQRDLKAAIGREARGGFGAVRERDPFAKLSGAVKTRKPRATFPLTHRIKVIVRSNPKRGKSAERFAVYTRDEDMTVGQALRKGATNGDLVWDTEHFFIKIYNPEEM